VNTIGAAKFLLERSENLLGTIDAPQMMTPEVDKRLVDLAGKDP
jgi:hypothetical protein